MPITTHATAQSRWTPRVLVMNVIAALGRTGMRCHHKADQPAQNRHDDPGMTTDKTKRDEISEAAQNECDQRWEAGGMGMIAIR